MIPGIVIPVLLIMLPHCLCPGIPPPSPTVPGSPALPSQTHRRPSRDPRRPTDQQQTLHRPGTDPVQTRHRPGTDPAQTRQTGGSHRAGRWSAGRVLQAPGEAGAGSGPAPALMDCPCCPLISNTPAPPPACALMDKHFFTSTRTKHRHRPIIINHCRTAGNSRHPLFPTPPTPSGRAERRRRTHTQSHLWAER